MHLLGTVFALSLLFATLQVTSCFESIILQAAARPSLLLDSGLPFNSNLTPIENILPAWNVASINKTRLNECYDATFGKANLDIFTHSLESIVREFCKELGIDRSQITVAKIENVLSNIKSLVKNIRQCLATSEMANRVGFTSLFLMSHAELQRRMIRIDTPTSKTAKKTLHRSGGESEESDDDVEGEDKVFNCQAAFDRLNRSNVPLRFDWREHGVVTPIKEQSSCGSCYIFGTVASAEAAYVLQLGRPLSNFSEQDIVNCYSNFAKGACSGGSVKNVLEFIMFRGLVKVGANTPPYVPDELPCEANQTHIADPVLDYCFFSRIQDDATLTALLYYFGPLAVPIKGIDHAFFNLRGPYYGGCPKPINAGGHVILLVGYNEHFLIFKNSWKPYWGVNGYLYLARTERNQRCSYRNFAGAPIFMPFEGPLGGHFMKDGEDDDD